MKIFLMIKMNQIKKCKKIEFSCQKLMIIFNHETTVSLINMKYKIKKEIKINYKIIIVIFNIIKSII